MNKFLHEFDGFFETKNLKTALNKARRAMNKIGLDSTWLELDITKENENLYVHQEGDYRLRIEKFDDVIASTCYYIDIAYN